jgi:hypothetical protein
VQLVLRFAVVSAMLICAGGTPVQVGILSGQDEATIPLISCCTIIFAWLAPS